MVRGIQWWTRQSKQYSSVAYIPAVPCPKPFRARRMFLASAAALDSSPKLRSGDPGPPRVDHIQCPADGAAAQVLASHLAMSVRPAHRSLSFLSPDLSWRTATVEWLLKMGAVYYCPVHPPPSKCNIKLTEEQTARVASIHQEGIALHGPNPQNYHPRRLFDGSMLVSRTGFFRVHVAPKRFPQALEIDWQSRIIADTEDFVVVSKPWGVQVTHRVDNVQESLTACVTRALGLKKELLPLHRLDCGTEGVVVLGKHAAFAKRFGKLLSDSSSLDSQRKCFVKTYLALTPAPAPVGVLRHHALINVKTKGLPASTRLVPTPREGSVECVLEVLEVTKVQLSEAAEAHWGVSEAWEHRVRLLTGRTHQIRVQLAAVAAPVLGDLLYSALLENGVFQAVPSHEPNQEHAEDPCETKQTNTSAAGEQMSVAATDFEQQAGTNEPLFGTEVPDWVDRYRESVRHETPIGLQAHMLEVQDVTCMGPPPVVYSAGCPWWRRLQSADVEGGVT